LIRILRPHVHVKGGDYANEALPEATAVHEIGGRVVIVPLAGSLSTTSMIERIVTQASCPPSVGAQFIAPGITCHTESMLKSKEEKP
jgi:D-beta-D-heptose 7-phosphate kinase/D-beta-D-heptose 1-phosphate adenosyltransferase